MADLQTEYEKVSMRSAIAELVDAVLDGTYKSIDDAQVAFEKSRQDPPKRQAEPAANDDRIARVRTPPLKRSSPLAND